MYAIIKTGGKQYRVSEGQTLRVEKLDGEQGDTVRLDNVLLLGGEGDTRIGTPLLDGAAVEARIVRQARAKKIIVFKKRRRKGYHKKQGHRQYFTELKITGISA
jgi:large subunit ribosomal protein L21